ncbi:peptidoglycan-recognition protein LE-like [Zophobas morio]|uniref:peptidoglycan-recognition protein LE-like n=1 Tax=Zophobas morio TaxID=2755281 RepID=UPI00308355F7
MASDTLSDVKKIEVVCKNCHRAINDGDNEYSEQKIDKCRQWLNSCGDLSSAESLSCCSYSDFPADDSTFDDNELIVASENVHISDKVLATTGENSITWDDITNNKPNHHKNIQIYKSQNVHVGNITHIHGPVYVNQYASTINQNILINNNNNNNKKIFPIVPRRTWLAQPPLEPSDVKYFTEPRKLVIINHSASEEAYTQTENNLLIRLIQQFHVESRKWNDIGYNFLAGADGSIYEGRGWDVIGAHTLAYNSVSIGICFVGCYIKTLPPDFVLKRVQELIKYGVEIGAIAEDYSLLGYCQCWSSESPGSRLFEELKTWERWDGSISVANPSPLMIT